MVQNRLNAGIDIFLQVAILRLKVDKFDLSGHSNQQFDSLIWYTTPQLQGTFPLPQQTSRRICLIGKIIHLDRALLKRKFFVKEPRQRNPATVCSSPHFSQLS